MTPKHNKIIVCYVGPIWHGYNHLANVPELEIILLSGRWRPFGDSTWRQCKSLAVIVLPQGDWLEFQTTHFGKARDANTVVQ